MTGFPITPDAGGDYELEERQALRRVAGLSTELQDISEVEYRQLRLERVVLVGVWTTGTLVDATVIASATATDEEARLRWGTDARRRFMAPRRMLPPMLTAGS